MKKQNLFSLISFLATVGWLEIFKIRHSIEYMIWICVFVTFSNLLYYWCKDDQDELDKR
jgi:hypothetical protein